jgi:hypothetical protein
MGGMENGSSALFHDGEIAASYPAATDGWQPGNAHLEMLERKAIGVGVVSAGRGLGECGIAFSLRMQCWMWVWGGKAEWRDRVL